MFLIKPARALCAQNRYFGYKPSRTIAATMANVVNFVARAQRHERADFSGIFYGCFVLVFARWFYAAAVVVNKLYEFEQLQLG